MKLLITGATGQLGRCLKDRLTHNPSFQFFALSSSELDITDRSVVAATVDHLKPDLIINAAAYTAVDKAEDDAKKAFLVNEKGVENLASVCASAAIPLIHVSTDYVFDGSATEPYRPDSATSPMGVYGASKLAGEKAALSLLEDVIIIRTSWVYSEYGNNFVKTMLRLAESRDEVSVVNDQVGCPTYAGNIAVAILRVCLELKEGAKQRGVYHYVDTPEMSWFDFARQIFSEAAEQELLEKKVSVNPIPTSAYPTKTARPAYSALDTLSLQTDFGVERGEVSASLGWVIKQLKTS